jgi:hypothetical protein
MENISALPDQPTLTAEQLKAEFDKAGVYIKAWINSVLKDYVDGLASGANIETDAITATKIKAGEVSKDKLAAAVQASLNKADSALQSVATANIADGAVTAAKLAALTTLKVSGAAIYGTEAQMNAISNPVTGQVFFKKV